MKKIKFNGKPYIMKLHKLFHQSIKETDTHLIKNKIIVLNTYLLCYSMLLMGLAISNLNGSKMFFFTHLSMFIFVLTNIFFRLKLNPFVYSVFIFIALMSNFMYMLEFGALSGAEIYFVTILTSLPIFLNWKTQKSYYYGLFFLVGIIFIGSYFLKEPFFLKGDTAEVFRNKRISTIYNTIFGSIGIMLNFYFIKKIDRVNHMPENNDTLQNLLKANDPLYIAEFKKNNPAFVKKLYAAHPNLSPNEFKFCSLLFLDFSSKEIASHLNLEYRTIQTKKNKLRRKLELETYTDLYAYMKSLDKKI
ncbi:helix-turn-helix transcriptional regulator [Chryseobacterium arthrosphaerae]|uniref:helix-turn-helix transcriptional regulator n=1 Tax=Chryseobacterium arthrosphaerae TaxID=651561 RepID=UPI003D3270E2